MNNKLLSSIIKKIANIPSVKINRKKYLAKEFAFNYPKLFADILEKGAYNAGVPIDVIDKKINKMIKYEVSKSAAISFVSGIPGGLLGLGTVTADNIQLLAHLIRIIQKMCYIFRMPIISDDKEEITDAEVDLIFIYMGVMNENKIAIKYLNEIENNHEFQLNDFIIMNELINNIIDKLIFRPTSSMAPAKALPIIGGLINSSFTCASSISMSYTLYKNIKIVKSISL